MLRDDNSRREGDIDIRCDEKDEDVVPLVASAATKGRDKFGV